MSKFFAKEMITLLEITSRKNFDIVQVILALAKYNLQANVTRKKIILEDVEIPNEVLKSISELVPKYIVRNFINQESLSETKNITSEQEKSKLEEKSSTIFSETYTQLKTLGKVEIYDLKFKSAKAGDVFYADFGVPYEHEIGFERPAIVLFEFDDRALVLPCTTNPKTFNGTFKLSFVKENFKSYNWIPNITESTGLINQLRVIDKSRLRQKIGSLSDEKMNEIRLTLETYFVFNITTLSYNQLKLLSLVDRDKLLECIKNSKPNNAKIDEILKLFGFDLTVQGVSYLSDAIQIALNLDNFNLDILCEKVSKSKNTIHPQQEVQRLIVARFKDRFNKKFKSIEFIRLIKTLLKEVTYEA